MGRSPSWDTGGDGIELSQDQLPWDTLVLRGVPLPGRATIHARRGRKHDRKGGPGCDGETFTDLGSKVAELDITVTVWSSEQLDALVAALDQALPAPKKIARKQVFASGDFSISGPNVHAGDAPTGAKVDRIEIINELTLKYVGSEIYVLSSKGGAAQPVAGESLEAIPISHPSLARLRVRSILIIEEENFQPGHEPGTFEWRCRAVEWMGKGSAAVVATAKGASIRLSERVAAGVPVSDAVAPSANSADRGP